MKSLMCVLLTVLVSMLFIHVGMKAMAKADCGYAAAMVQQIDDNKYRYNSLDEYYAARAYHAEYLSTCEK